jgi:hypothetical protein
MGAVGAMKHLAENFGQVRLGPVTQHFWIPAFRCPDLKEEQMWSWMC